MKQEKVDRAAELEALARLVSYAQQCAGVISAAQVEKRLGSVLEAINVELGERESVSLAETLSLENKTMTVQ